MNKAMISVTRVLDSYQEPEIVEWKVRVGKIKAEAISKKALDIGKRVDANIQSDIKGIGYTLIKDDFDVNNAMGGWEAFKKDHPEYVKDIEDIQVELTSGDLVGHPDIVHKLEISDIKTGNSLTIRPKYVVQASKYALMKGKDRASIILLSKINAESYQYVWWDKELIEYFGGKVFDAFRTIYEYGDMVSEMVRNFMEKEMLG